MNRNVYYTLQCRYVNIQRLGLRPARKTWNTCGITQTWSNDDFKGQSFTLQHVLLNLLD